MVAYAGLFKKTKSTKVQEDPMAPFSWFQYIWFFIDTMRMTEEQVLDYGYIDSLNWLSFHKLKRDQEEMANGRLA